MSTTDEYLLRAPEVAGVRIERALDPTAVATGLARSGIFDEYVGYERERRLGFCRRGAGPSGARP